MTKSIYIHALLQTQSIYFQFIFDQKSNTLDNFTKLFSLHEKHTYMFICYRFQTCCNIKIYIYIVTLAAVIIFFFLKIISLIHSVNTSFMGKEKVYTFHIYFLITTLYICICFLFFNNAKRPRGLPFQILLRVMLFGALTSRDSYNYFCRWS